ncbi:MAG: RNA methyltransferase, partial [Streptococcaceae bacterium]|nr:RNA methyltransferase [Streptococcaceae bacterium]
MDNSIITSKDNNRVKEARKLLQKKYRDKSASYLIEGFHLFEEAVKSGAEIRQLFVEEGKENRLQGFELELENCFVVTENVLKSLSETESPQGLVAELVRKELQVDFETNLEGKILILENAQDPGNVGTLIRTADAAGFDTVICVGQTADIYSPKVLRSAQGSTFHLSIQTYSELP